MRVLLVEDSDTQAKEIGTYLSECTNGEYWIWERVNTIAAALAKHEAFDAVLLDLELPDSTTNITITLIPEFKKPVIIVSNTTDTDTIKLCREQGATAFLAKPHVSMPAIKQAVVSGTWLPRVSDYTKRIRQATARLKACG